MIIASGILTWLSNYDEVARERIIENTYNLTLNVIEKYNLGGFNNSMNRLADVFDLVFSYMKFEIAPDNNSTEQDFADYNSLMTNDVDLPLIVLRTVTKHFKHIEVTDADIEYCERQIMNYMDVRRF